MRGSAAAWIGCVALVAIAMPGCFFKGEFADYCDKKMTCEGGNDADRSACNDANEAQEDAANEYGCSSQFDDADKCVEQNSTCTSGAYTTSNCDAQSKALGECIQNASGLKH